MSSPHVYMCSTVDVRSLLRYLNRQIEASKSLQKRLTQRRELDKGVDSTKQYVSPPGIQIRKKGSRAVEHDYSSSLLIEGQYRHWPRYYNIHSSLYPMLNLLIDTYSSSFHQKSDMGTLSKCVPIFMQRTQSVSYKELNNTQLPGLLLVFFILKAIRGEI
jgi:hypothetical protein